MRTVGAVVRGIRTPIVREGDDLVSLVRDSVLAASETEHFTFHDRDIVAVGIDEAGVHGRFLPEVSGEGNVVDMRVLFGKILEDFQGLVPGAVVDKNQFIVVFQFLHHFRDDWVEQRQSLFFVVAGNDD